MKTLKFSIQGYMNDKLEKLRIKINNSKQEWSDLLLFYNPCEDTNKSNLVTTLREWIKTNFMLTSERDNEIHKKIADRKSF